MVWLPAQCKVTVLNCPGLAFPVCLLPEEDYVEVTKFFHLSTQPPLGGLIYT